MPPPTTSLHKRHPKATIAVVLTALITLIGIYVGQTQQSFEINLNTVFQKFDIKPILIPILSKPVTIPDIHQNFSKGSISGNANATNVTCNDFNAVSAYLMPDHGMMDITITNISLVCTGNWSAKISLVPEISGWFTLTVLSGNVSAALDISNLASRHMDVRLDSCSSTVATDINFAGSSLAGMMNKAKSYILPPLNTKLEGYVCQTVRSLIVHNGKNQPLPPPPSEPTKALAKIATQAIPLNNTLFVHHETYSVWEGCSKLWSIKEYTLALLIAILSGVWPYLKNVLVLVLWFTPCGTPRRTHKVLMIIEWIGKWSMVDVFFVAMLTFALKLSLNTIVAGDLVVSYSVGAFVYTGSICLSLGLTAVVTNIAWKDVKQRVTYKTSQGSDVEDAMHSMDTVDSEVESIHDEDATLVSRGMSANKNIVKSSRGGLYLQTTPTTLKPTKPTGASSPVAMALFVTVIVSCVVIGYLGLFLPSYYLTKAIKVDVLGKHMGPHEEAKISLATTISYLNDAAVRGIDMFLVIVVALFVVVLPVCKWAVVVLIFLYSCLFECKNWKQKIAGWVVDLQGWDMRDVFLVTLAVLSIRITQMIDALSEGFANITVQTNQMPGWWACWVAIPLLEYPLYIFFRWWLKK